MVTNRPGTGRALRAIGAVLVATAGLGACSDEGTDRTQRSFSPPSSARPGGVVHTERSFSPPSTTIPSGGAVTTTAPTRAAASQAVLLAVALRREDVPEGVTLQLIPGGNRVVDQVTMDMCGADFASERLRTARLQQAAIRSTAEIVVNNENVIYRSPEAAAQALAEVREAVAACDPDAFVEVEQAGGRRFRFEIAPIPDALLADLTDDRVAVTAKVTDEDGRSESYALVYQRRGALMVGMYGPSPDQVLPYARLVAPRMAAAIPD